MEILIGIILWENNAKSGKSESGIFAMEFDHWNSFSSFTITSVIWRAYFNAIQIRIMCQNKNTTFCNSKEMFQLKLEYWPKIWLKSKIPSNFMILNDI